MFAIETQGAVDVIIPDAALNHDTAGRLQETVHSLPAEGQPMLVIDMSQVPLVDSAALETLLDIRDELHESGGTVKLAGLSQLCEDVFRVTGLGETFEIYHDAKAAVRSYVR